jgi:transposase
MDTRRIVLHGRTREKLKKIARRCKEADLRARYRIVLLCADGWSGRRIANALGCCSSTVSRTLDRWEEFGEAGLMDRREDNGECKADAWYVATVRWILAGTPQAFFHHRPPWTKALLIQTARQYTGVTVSNTTMGRVLKGIGARRGRPKPVDFNPRIGPDWMLPGTQRHVMTPGRTSSATSPPRWTPGPIA